MAATVSAARLFVDNTCRETRLWPRAQSEPDCYVPSVGPAARRTSHLATVHVVGAISPHYAQLMCRALPDSLMRRRTCIHCLIVPALVQPPVSHLSLATTMQCSCHPVPGSIAARNGTLPQSSRRHATSQLVAASIAEYTSMPTCAMAASMSSSLPAALASLHVHICKLNSITACTITQAIALASMAVRA